MRSVVSVNETSREKFSILTDLNPDRSEHTSNEKKIWTYFNFYSDRWKSVWINLDGGKIDKSRDKLHR